MNAPDVLTEASRSSMQSSRICYIVTGNHNSYHGIGDIIYTLDTYLSGHFRTQVSESIVLGEINVVIDEFSTPSRVEALKQAKQQAPHTRFILMATEFITEISLPGLKFGKTFNFFDPRDDARHVVSLLAHRMRLKASPPYLYSRYRGFVDALPFVDLILCAHRDVAATLKRLPANDAKLPGDPLTLYPQIDLDRLARDSRLHNREAGFVITGTMTRFRARMAETLDKTFKDAGIAGPVLQHQRFEQSRTPALEDGKLDLGYDEVDQRDRLSWHRAGLKNYIYNLNPPQRANWAYSSPMRILRAILFGQIPVVTRMFGDHDIEMTALVWDGTAATAKRMWHDATEGRSALVERHLAAVAAYNIVARAKNAQIDCALRDL